MNLLFANDRTGQYPASWYAATAQPLMPFAPLEGEARADVCIVGAGYTGLSAALHLAQKGLDVVVLEAHRVGFGASGRNGGQVGSGQRLDQEALEKSEGTENARRLWDIAEDAKATVRSVIETHGIDALWRPGVGHAAYRAADSNSLARHAEHMAKAYGYDRIELLDRAAIAERTGSPVFQAGAMDHGAGHVHPLRLALGLARAASLAGARLHEGSLVTALGPDSVTTDNGRVTAPQILLACNGYLGRLEPVTAARVMPINNFIVATEPLDRFPEVLPGDHAFADDKFVINYWRKSHDNRLLFGGGESYGYRFPADIAALVRKPMERVYPQLEGIRIDYAWGGTLAISMSRMPVFARPRPGFWTAAGYSGHGVALSIMAGRILAEAIAGETGRFDVMARLKSPRFPGGTALRAPLLTLAMTWYALRDRLGL
jgi:gamma-glutamylputrescine oxidase